MKDPEQTLDHHLQAIEDMVAEMQTELGLRYDRIQELEKQLEHRDQSDPWDIIVRKNDMILSLEESLRLQDEANCVLTRWYEEDHKTKLDLISENKDLKHDLEEMTTSRNRMLDIGCSLGLLLISLVMLYVYIYYTL